jgi:predicted transcriptional regulator
MILKSKVLDFIDPLSDEFEVDVLIEKIIILDKISKSEEQYEKGETYTQEEVEKEVNQWFD